MTTITDLEKTIDAMEKRLVTLEHWHDTNGFPLLAYHNESIGKYQKVINPEFEAEQLAVEQAKKEVKT